MLIEDDGSDCPNDKVKTKTITNTNIESSSPEEDTSLYRISFAQDLTSKSRVSVDPSALKIEDGCYIDRDGLLLSLKLGE